MATATVSHVITCNGEQISSQTSHTGTLVSMPAQSCPTGQSTNLIVPVDVSATKAFAVTSDQAVTLKTNSSGSPDDTIALTASTPYIWTNSMYDTFQLGTDVVSFYITNASGSTASVSIMAIIDSTP